MIKIAGIVKNSIVDGSGIRYVIFTQGCPRDCEGCFNPQTHDPDLGYFKSIDEIIKEIDDDKLIDGVTISGGEPFLQAKKLVRLAEIVKSRNLLLDVFTGYLFEDLKKDSQSVELLKLVDVLVDGEFVKSLYDPSLKYYGSSNQRMIDVKESFKQNETVIVTF